MSSIDTIATIIGLGFGWACALRVEKRYISRPAQPFVAMDAFLLMRGRDFIGKLCETSNLFLAWESWRVACWLKCYLCAGVVLGFIGFYCYLVNQSLPGIFYKIAYRFFSSKTVIPLSTVYTVFSYCNFPLYSSSFWGYSGFLILLTWCPKTTIFLIRICSFLVTAFIQ